MTDYELEQWLCGAEVPLQSPAATAAALGLCADALRDTTLLRVASHVRSLRLTLAVLRDVFPNDDDMRAWLDTPSDALDGDTPANALVRGESRAVAMLAVHTWNASTCVGAS